MNILQPNYIQNNPDNQPEDDNLNFPPWTKTSTSNPPCVDAIVGGYCARKWCGGASGYMIYGGCYDAESDGAVECGDR